jgi:ribosomal protein S18 acetylase RimI-like enzyme
MSVEIRELSAADVAAALALWRRSEGVALTGDTAATLTDYLARNPGLSFVAFEGGALVGAVLCGHDGRRGYLHHLAVAPAQRRRGIGTALVRCCLAGLEALEIVKCHLFVQRGNEGALAFWRRAGWAERSDLVTMSRALRARG